MARTPERSTLTMRHTDGKNYSVDYSVQGKTVTLHTLDGHRSAHISGLTPQSEVRMLLRELIEAGNVTPD